MRLNMERFLDLIIDMYDNDENYSRTCAKYRETHGYTPCLDIRNGLNDEKQHIFYLYKWSDASRDTVAGIMDVLAMDEEQKSRAYTAGRALRRWYRMTGWARLPSDDMLNRIAGFIFG